MRMLLVVPLLMLGGCSIFQDPATLARAIEVINASDLPAETKAVLIEALNAALSGGGIREVLGDVADGIVAAVAAWFGFRNVPKIFGKKNPEAAKT